MNRFSNHYGQYHMDHFNAMFEDQGTGSWWRKVRGEGIAGSLKGATLPELSSGQYTLGAP